MKYFINPTGFTPGMAYSMADDEGVFFVSKDGRVDRVKRITKVYADNLCQDGIWKEITPEEARKLLVIDLSDMRREWNYLTFSQVASVMEEIKRLEKAIPEGQASISLCLRSDMSWCVLLDVWGREIAMITKGEPEFCLRQVSTCRREKEIVRDVNKAIPKDLP